jgi:hypothetical protein
MQGVIEGMSRNRNAVLVKSGYRFSERDRALPNELSAVRVSSSLRATVFEV